MLIVTLSYSTIESSIQLQREESAEKSNESKKTLFYFVSVEAVDTAICLQIACNVFPRQSTCDQNETKLNFFLVYWILLFNHKWI